MNLNPNSNRILTLFFVFIISFLNAQDDTLNSYGKYAFTPKSSIDYLSDGDTVRLPYEIYKTKKNEALKFGFYDSKSLVKQTDADYDTIIFRKIPQKDLSYYLISNNGKWGLLNADKSTWIETTYDALNFNKTSSNLFITAELNGLYGIIDQGGKEIIECKYDEIAFDDFSFLTKKKDKWGLFNSKGKNLIPVCFDQVFPHKNHLQSIVRNENEWSLFNWIKDDPCAFNIKYDNIEALMEYYIVRKETKFALLDLNAKEIIAFEYDYMASFFLDYLRSLIVGKNKKVGLIRIDSLGQTIPSVPIEYDDIWVDESTFKIKVKLGDKIDYFFNDKALFDLQYNDLQYYPRIDKMAVKKGNKWGLVETNGKEIIPIAFSKIHILKDDQYLVQKVNLWGLYNNFGKELIPANYDEFDYRPEKDFFFVRKKNKWGIISTTKGLILPPKYDDMMTLSNRNFLVKINDQWGIAAPGGRMIIEAEYSSYQYKFKSNYIVLTKKDGSIRKYRLN